MQYQWARRFLNVLMLQFSSGCVIFDPLELTAAGYYLLAHEHLESAFESAFDATPHDGFIAVHGAAG